MTAAVPGQADMAALVRAAQAADHATRPAGRNWTRVGDDQVARLIGGAQAAAIAAQDARPAPELDLASDEMRPGELDTTLATVPPCEEISSWGMRCRVIRAHETHRDRDGNMWQPERELAARPAPELAALRLAAVRSILFDDSMSAEDARSRAAAAAYGDAPPKPPQELAAAMAVLAKVRAACERPAGVVGHASGSRVVNGDYLARHLLDIIKRAGLSS